MTFYHEPNSEMLYRRIGARRVNPTLFPYFSRGYPEHDQSDYDTICVQETIGDRGCSHTSIKLRNKPIMTRKRALCFSYVK